MNLTYMVVALIITRATTFLLVNMNVIKDMDFTVYIFFINIQILKGGILLEQKEIFR